MPKDESFPIANRSGEGELETRDLLHLLGSSCVPGDINIGFGCNDVEYLDTVNVTLPAYPGCTFVIVYKHYECAFAGLKDYTMGDFQILSHNCPAFSTALNSYSVSSAAFGTFIDNFNLAVYNALETIIIAQEVPSGSYPCLQGLYFQIIFIKASCYKNCIIEYSDGSASMVKIACGVDCCERHTRVCRQANGTIYKETSIAPPDQSYCEDPEDFEGNPILSLCVRETSCAYKCP